MRVISGEAAGRRLKAPKSGIRPLTDYVKQALFNILQNRILDSVFLDLFAGSGAVGIEALSRGAKKAYFAENNRATVEFLRDNLKMTKLMDRAQVYPVDVLRAVKLIEENKEKVSIIFIGAPYDDPKLEQALIQIAEADILDEDAIVIAEHRKQHKLADKFARLKKNDERVYGDTVLSFYQKDSE